MTSGRAPVRPDGALVVGTHNMADRPVATPFADLIGWTEAAHRDAIVDDLPGHYVTVVCKAQRSLAVSYDARRLVLLSQHHRRAHDGEARVSPGRGTWRLVFRDLQTGRTLTVLLAHRVNNAHGPVRRAGRALREAMWAAHYWLDALLVRRALERTDDVIALGDLNRRHGRVWPQLEQTRLGYDRIGWSKTLRPVGDLEVLGSAGSDHPRKRITLAPRTLVRSTP